jgi:valyl-tRNA synthetase
MAEDMQKQGLMVKIDPDYTHKVATCYKCGTILEPRILPQWFLKMTSKPSLRDLAVKAVRKGEIKFIPSRMEKIFMHWMKNLRDWNISRQIVWGIRIPAWYCQEMKNCIIVSKTQPKKCPHCQSTKIVQDSDVFDTWFSSGQWPFATLMTTKKGDFKKFYPTNVMETGHDILFFWVARMIMLGLYRTGKIPFHTVYLHGMVRDKDRQKMSKSKGNVIDPLGVAELYGTDAVRMALIVGNTAGNDIIISEEKIRGYRNFANKIWNATRFVLQQNASEKRKVKDAKQKRRDKTEISKLKKLVKETTKDIENFRFHHAANRLYHFFWHYFADKIIEDYKKGLVSRKVLLRFHQTLIKLLHPFMPFATEEIYQMLKLKNKKKCLMVEQWPR